MGKGKNRIGLVLDGGVAAIFGIALARSAAIVFAAAPIEALDRALHGIAAGAVGTCAFLFAFTIMRMVDPRPVDAASDQRVARDELDIERIASVESMLGHAEPVVSAPEPAVPTQAVDATDGLMGTIGSLRRA